MRYRMLILWVAFLHFGYSSHAQKPFMEGTIDYKVKLTTADGRIFDGTFTYTIKTGKIKKELKLNNGYQYTQLINTANNTIYSLQTRNGKNYAIQLTMDEVAQAQKKYTGFTCKEDRNSSKAIAGIRAYREDITYPDGTRSEVYATSDWYPDKSITYDCFPNAKFLPLYYTYKDETGSGMQLEAKELSILPVENAYFKVPADYKIISNTEYKQLRK